MSTVGMLLLSAVVKNASKSALAELSSEIMGNESEKAVFNYVHNYIDTHGVFPKLKTVMRETKIRMPVPDEPYTYYLAETKNRALYGAIRDPYSAMTEALQSTGRIDMATVIDCINQMSTNVNRYVATGSGVETSETVLERILDEYNEAKTNHGLIGIPSGYDGVDEATLGYQPEDLIVWVGRPGRGKSWLLIKQAYEAWMRGYKVLYVSNEMSGEATMRRMLGLHSGVNPTLIRRGNIQSLAEPHLLRKYEEMQEMNPINICTANFNRSVEQLDGFMEQYLPDIVYVDAGYLMAPKKKRYGSSGRRETISDVIEEMKQLASNAHRPLVTTVQFNREAEKRKRAAIGRNAEGEAVVVNPIAHLGLDVIGETDVISQSASHVLGIDYPAYPFEKEMRVFGFLKGREGEDGYWYCNYPKNQSSTIDLSIIDYNDPRLEQLRTATATTERGGQRRQRNLQRTDLSFMQANRPNAGGNDAQA